MHHSNKQLCFLPAALSIIHMHYPSEPDFEPVPNLLRFEPSSDCISLARNKSEIIDTLTSLHSQCSIYIPDIDLKVGKAMLRGHKYFWIDVKK